jgi:hypothetical protein
VNALHNSFDPKNCALAGEFEDGRQLTNAVMDHTERTATTIVCMPQVRNKLTDENVAEMADKVAECQQCQGVPSEANCQLGDLVLQAAAKIT